MDINDTEKTRAAKPPELPAGYEMHGHRIVRKIGEGGMGYVYEAIHIGLNERRALKQSFYYEDKAWFENEAKLLCRLKHPYLPRVHDYFEEGNSCFLAMDLIDGPSLQTKVKEPGVISASEIVQWAKQVLDALIYMHQEGIIHRDIKPDNIRIEGNKAFLVDFGLAKEVAAGTIVHGHSPDYSAPEQIYGTSNEQSDIYSLGATLYHLLTGVRPARAANRRSALLNKQPDPLLRIEKSNRKVPKWLVAVIYKAMAYEPSDRFESAQSMLAFLDAEETPVDYSSNRQASSQKGKPGKGSERTKRETTRKSEGDKVSRSKAKSTSSLSNVGCALLIAGIIAIIGWFLWPSTSWAEVSCEPQWAKPSASPNPSISNNSAKLEMTVEKVGIVKGITFYKPENKESNNFPVALGETNLQLAVRILPDSDRAWLDKARGAYLIDDRGTRYDIRQDNTITTSAGDGRELVRNEVYRFNLFFPKIEDKTPYIHFNHPRFQPIKINLKW